MIGCPKCNSASGVLDSRVQANNTMVRRRQCKVCNFRWTTREISNDEWREIQAARKKRAKHAKAMSEKGVLARRGFVVPDHLKDEYNHLRISKAIPAREAARILGIIEDDDNER